MCIQRSEGHGVWSRTGTGDSARSVVVIAFETPPGTPPGSSGFLAGWSVTSSTITMTSADSFQSSNTTDFYDLNRMQYRSLCATTVGERFR